MNNKKLTIFFVFAFLFTINFVAWAKIYDLNQPQEFKVVFFDVEQGDSALIKTNLGHYILIDGGESSLILEKLSQKIPFYEKKIDLIVLTHAHADHLGGLIHVLENYHVENVLWNGVRTDTNLFDKWQRLLEEKDYNIKISEAGQRIKSGSFFIDVLYPFKKINDEFFKDVNLSSIILRIVYNNNSFLFTGDAYHLIEQELIEMEEFCRDKTKEIECRGMTLKSDVLKVGHHGSKTSTSENFIEKVMPFIAVISSEESNRHGHPHQETLEVLKKYDIKVARTDKEGDIEIIIQ